MIPTLLILLSLWLNKIDPFLGAILLVIGAALALKDLRKNK